MENEMKMEKLRIKLIYMILTIQLVQCSLPEVVEPVEWKIHVEFPVADQKIPITSILNDRSTGDFNFDSSESGDTIVCIRTDTVGCTFEQKITIPDSSEFQQRLGTFTISRMNPVNIMLGIAGELPIKKNSETVLQDEETISLSRKKLIIEGISYIVFDDSSPELEIYISNKSTCCEMNDIVIALLDNNDVFAVVHVPQLSAREHKIVAVPVAGKKISSPVAVALSASIPRGTVIHSSDQIQISFSFNGLVISEAEIEDRLINYHSIVSGVIPLADSLKIEHMETEDVSIELNIRSPAQFKVKLSGSFYNPENTEIFQLGNQNQDCRMQNVYDGDKSHLFTGDTITALLDSGFQPFHLPLRTMTLYPGFDSRHAYSTLGCAFRFDIIPDGRNIRFNKNDKLILKIKLKDFPLRSMNGSFLKKLEYTESTSVNSGLTAATDDIRRLQNALSFKSAKLKFGLDPGIVDGCSIDSLIVQAVMKAGQLESDSVLLSQTITGITSASNHNAVMDFTGLFNRWPDIFTFNVKLLLPPGTGFSLNQVNDDFKKLNTVFQLKPVLTWKVIVPLCWEIKEKTHFEMEKSEIVLTEEQISNARKIKKPSIKIYMDLFNQTNIHCRIFALGAIKEYVDSLNAYPDSLISMNRFTENLNHGLFPVAGKNGIVLAPRNNISFNEIVFDASTIHEFLDAGHCVIRWFIFFESGPPDALMSNDFINIKATGVIEGIGSSDLLTKT